MKSVELQKQITEARARRENMAVQVEQAEASLKAEQKQLARGKGSADATTQAQAKFSALVGTLQMIDADIVELEAEYGRVVKAEARDAQLAKLTDFADAANESWRNYQSTYAASIHAIEHAAKSLMAAHEKHRANVLCAKLLCTGPGAVSLSDIQTDTTGASKDLAYWGVPPVLSAVNGEDAKYRAVLVDLAGFVGRCDCRPCPEPPAAN